MPDLATHVLAVTPFLRKAARRPELVLLGTILPDLAGRLAVLKPNSVFLFWMGNALHAPVGMALIVYALAMFFPREKRAGVLAGVGAGAAFHFVLDLLQKTVTFGPLWLFPASLASFQIPLIWGDESFFALPFLVLLNLLVYALPSAAGLKKRG
jgi:Na+/proline symporter